jgi:hypothetical protein
MDGTLTPVAEGNAVPYGRFSGLGGQAQSVIPANAATSSRSSKAIACRGFRGPLKPSTDVPFRAGTFVAARVGAGGRLPWPDDEFTVKLLSGRPSAGSSQTEQRRRLLLGRPAAIGLQ